MQYLQAPDGFLRANNDKLFSIAFLWFFGRIAIFLMPSLTDFRNLGVQYTYLCLRLRVKLVAAYNASKICMEIF